MPGRRRVAHRFFRHHAVDRHRVRAERQQLVWLGGFERLQEAHPGRFPDGQLRTLQRRVETWRHVLAHRMVFGAAAAGVISGQASLHAAHKVGVAPVS